MLCKDFIRIRSKFRVISTLTNKKTTYYHDRTNVIQGIQTCITCNAVKDVKNQVIQMRLPSNKD